MKREICVNGRRFTLDPAQLIQSGGEGMVFGMGDGTAVKLYHNPTKQRAEKLRCWLNGLAGRLPDSILGPSALVADCSGKVIGFQMPRLPAGSLPIKKLASPLFWQKNKLFVDDVLGLFRQVHQTLTRLHQLGVIVGDLNDHNLFFSPANLPAGSPAFIDADSYQFAQFPCPVAMQSFLDPNLYYVTDFGRRSYFTPQSDWYAFAVLLVKSLLHVHPYGGTHKQHKSVMARAGAKVSILDTAVTYPQNARSLDTISADWKQQIHLIFERDQRHPFPARLLAGQHFSQSASQPVRVSALRSQSSKLLLSVDGVIEHAAVMANGRIRVVVREDGAYRLVRLGVGGILDEMALFDGQPGYRFGNFGRYLAVNPPGRPHLLILDVGGSQPQKVTMVETALFRDTAVFAATARHLYRIAGTWIMRGSVRNGLYVEDAIATAHRNQTRFWASPLSETLAGYHRIFAEHRFFLIHDGAAYDIPVPPLGRGASLAETAVTFTNRAVIIQRTIRRQGQPYTDVHTADFEGNLRSLPTQLLPANTLLHPAGRLLMEPSRLTLIKNQI